MAYVSDQYDHDIFISYARVDDQKDPGVEQGWVTCFQQALVNGLSKHLKERRTCRIWWDRSAIDEAQPLEAQIGDTLRSTAALVVILSNGYVKSEWCKLEREVFLDAVSGRTFSDSRTFLVDIGNLPLVKRPEEFRQYAGFQFC